MVNEAVAAQIHLTDLGFYRDSSFKVLKIPAMHSGFYIHAFCAFEESKMKIRERMFHWNNFMEKKSLKHKKALFNQERIEHWFNSRRRITNNQSESIRLGNLSSPPRHQMPLFIKIQIRLPAALIKHATHSSPADPLSKLNPARKSPPKAHRSQTNKRSPALARESTDPPIHTKQQSMAAPNAPCTRAW